MRLSRQQAAALARALYKPVIEDILRTLYEITAGFGGAEWNVFRVRDAKYIGKVFGCSSGFDNGMTAAKLREEARRLVQEQT